jgi:hypothetical protein
MSMSTTSSLRLLGERVGILPEYVNFNGTRRVITPDQTYKAILRCMGYAVDDGESVQHSLQAVNALDRARDTAPIAPEKCVTCAEKATSRQLRGTWANLYTIRSQTNWGVGDLETSDGSFPGRVRWAWHSWPSILCTHYAIAGMM